MGNYKIKICYVANTDTTIKFILLNYLKLLKNEGYEVFAICSQGSWIKDIEAEGIKVKIINFKRKISPFFDIIALAKLFFYFRKEKFQIVHTHNPKPGLLGQIAARLAKVPIVINTIHGFYFNEYSSYFRKKLVILMEKVSALFSNLIFSVSKEDVETAIKEGVCLAQKIKYLGNGIDLEKFNKNRFDQDFINKKKEKLGISPKKKIIGVIGRLVKEKGYLELFEAMKMVLKKFPETLLLVIGPEDPEKKDAIDSSIVKDYGVEKNVSFLGERGDIEEIYPLMDIFILPSHREGLPYSILEASAMERTVVATNIRGCREAVEDGVTGILFPFRDSENLARAIVYLLENPERLKELGKNGREKIKKEFDEKIIFNRIKLEYNRLLGEKMKKDFEQDWLEKYEIAARERAQDYKILFSSKDAIKNYQKYFLEYFKQHLKKDNSKEKLLDLGCGLGTFSKLLKAKGFEVYGVDYSREIIRIARERYGREKIEFEIADIRNLPFSDNFIDIAISLGVFQCLSDPEKALKEIKRVLKKNGVAVITSLSSLSIDSFFQKEEVIRYNPYNFRKIMQKEGFKNIKIRGIYFLPSFLNFFVDLILRWKIYKFLNLFFPLFCIFSHAFYIEGIKQND